MDNFRKAFYRHHDKIEVPICFYEDEDGNRVYDIQSMTEEFENELSRLVDEDDGSKVLTMSTWPDDDENND